MATTVTLRNTGPTPVVLHLLHADYCAAAGECSCTRANVGITRADRTISVEPRLLPGTLHLTARGTKGDALQGLPLAIQHVADVKERRGRGLEVAVVQSKPHEPPVPDAVTSASGADSTSITTTNTTES